MDPIPDGSRERTERFSHRDFAVTMTMPRSADELIDVAEFEADERIPYWAELWPSARALTRELLDRDPPQGRAIELGCGLGLPSIALRWRGSDVLATDYYTAALEFVVANAAANGIPAPRTALLDWRSPPPEIGRFDTIIAADVLYERRNAEVLAALVPRLAAPGGRLVIADPGRAYRSEFDRAMEAIGWRLVSETVRDERATVSGREVVSRVRISELRPPE